MPEQYRCFKSGQESWEDDDHFHCSSTSLVGGEIAHCLAAFRLMSNSMTNGGRCMNSYYHISQFSLKILVYSILSKLHSIASHS